MFSPGARAARRDLFLVSALVALFWGCWAPPRPPDEGDLGLSDILCPVTTSWEVLQDTGIETPVRETTWWVTVKQCGRYKVLVTPVPVVEMKSKVSVILALHTLPMRCLCNTWLPELYLAQYWLLTVSRQRTPQSVYTHLVFVTHSTSAWSSLGTVNCLQHWLQHYNSSHCKDVNLHVNTPGESSRA